MMWLTVAVTLAAGAPAEVPIPPLADDATVLDTKPASETMAAAPAPAPPAAPTPWALGLEVGFDVHDGLLAPAVGQGRVVGAADHVEHDRPGAEVERHVLADMGSGMAPHLETGEAAPLDVVDADRDCRSAP